MSLIYHPDRHPGQSDSARGAAERRFQEINEAYEAVCMSPCTATVVDIEARVAVIKC